MENVRLAQDSALHRCQDDISVSSLGRSQGLRRWECRGLRGVTGCLTVVAKRFDLLHTAGDGCRARVELQVAEHLPQVLDLLLQGLGVAGAVLHRGGGGAELNPERELEPVPGDQEQHHQDQDAEENKHKRGPKGGDLAQEIGEHRAQRPGSPEHEELIECPTC